MQSQKIQMAFVSLQIASEKLNIELRAQDDGRIMFQRVQLSKALYEFIAELDKSRAPIRSRALRLIRESRRLLESAYRIVPAYS